jgi:hypothetical protein
MNTILFITAFKDIGRSNWPTHKRTNQDYLNYFMILANNINYNLVVYLEKEFLQEVKNRYNFKENIIFIELNEVDTFYNKYLEEERRVISDKKFQNKIPKERFRKHPETWSAKYTLINHSKINFVRHTKDIYPDYSFYSWIDFGYVRNLNRVPKNLNLDNFPDRIIYQKFDNIPEPRLNAIKMLTIDEAKIAGSAFVIPKTLINRFENLYENKIKLWHENYICDDDQSLVLQLYYENKHLFHLITDKDWFSLYNHLCNIEKQNYLDGEDAVRYILRNKIEGCFVECGVEYGRMEKIWINELKINNEERDIYLYDTFAGLTKPTDKDYAEENNGPTLVYKSHESVLDEWNKKIINSETNGWCYSSLSNVKANIEGSGYNDDKLHYIIGDVCLTLNDYNNIPDKIALLRLDTDWYESSKIELVKLYPRVSSGGIIIFDDYYFWNGQKEATDEYFKEIKENYKFYKVNSQTSAIIKK